MTNIFNVDPPSKNPIELGEVNWIRDYNHALSQSKVSDKPVFMLFQEVPGCSTCRNYGENILSHPLMVEAIEDLFVPLAIFNNKGGADKEVLDLYGEPTWNNPVVRIVKENGDNIIPRVAGMYTVLDVSKAMVEALKKSDKSVPQFLIDLIEAEQASRAGLEERTYSMYCFWSGEGNLGKIDGVVETSPGFANGKEVVKVKYNPDVIHKSQLDKNAKAHNYQIEVKYPKFREDKDPQYYLKKSDYSYLPLTTAQRTKINSVIGTGGNANKHLSPRQLYWLSLKLVMLDRSSL